MSDVLLIFFLWKSLNIYSAVKEDVSLVSSSTFDFKVNNNN